MRISTIVAVAAAFPLTCAMAQSSVNLFGMVDLGLAHVNASQGSSTLLASSGDGASRIGFRAIEDLGGGLKVSAWLEAGLRPDTGNGFVSNVNNQGSPSGLSGLTFNRRSTVGILSPWGELRLGRDLQPHYRNIVFYDPFNTLSVGSSVIVGSTVGGSANTWIRSSNGIQYFTPDTKNGPFANVTYFLGENPRDGAATQKDGTGWSARVGYTSEGFDVGVGAMKTSYAAGDVSNWSLAGSVTTGALKWVGVYVRDRVQGPRPDGRGAQLGAVWTQGAHKFRFSVGTYQTSAANRPRADKVAVGYTHSLSRSTAVYTNLAYVRNKNGATQTIYATPTGLNGRATGIDIGMRMAF